MPTTPSCMAFCPSQRMADSMCGLSMFAFAVGGFVLIEELLGDQKVHQATGGHGGGWLLLHGARLI